MFGLLQKMDRFSNKLMSREENIDFIQEIVDNGMVWEMHSMHRVTKWTLEGITHLTQPFVVKGLTLSLLEPGSHRMASRWTAGFTHKRLFIYIIMLTFRNRYEIMVLEKRLGN